MKRNTIIIRYIILTGLLLNALWAQGSLLLVGGGGEDYYSWSDLPYGWFVEKADSGKIINIDVDQVSSWYPGYFESLGAESGCEALRISSKSQANDSSVYKKLVSAKGIFMEGGDQYDYVSTWKGTLVEDAIHKVFNEGGAIGGTSAGLAVLGSVCFDAKNGSSYPEDVIYNPYDTRVHFTDDFLEILPDVLTDSHFYSRGRIGRLVPMLARRITDHGETDIIGIGVADKTALCIDADGNSTAYGEGSVTLLYKDDTSQISCEPIEPLLFTDVHLDQLVHGAQYNLITRTLIDPGPSMESVTPAEFQDTFQDTIINGSDSEATGLGEIEIIRLTSYELNAWHGSLRQQEGSGALPGTIIIPKIWNNYDYYENRWMGGIWGAVTNPGITVVYVDEGSQCHVDESGILTVDSLAHVLETRDVSYAGVSGYKVTNYSGLIGARLHFLNEGQQYDLARRELVSGLEPVNIQTVTYFLIIGHYPNPFNAECQIQYMIPGNAEVSLDIYTITGRLVDSLRQQVPRKGVYHFRWNAENRASGLYVFSLTSKYGVSASKALLLR